jgi:hypothetical protein
VVPFPCGLSLPALGRPDDGAFDGGVSHPPAASGPVDDLNRRVGRGHLSSISACLVYAVSAVLTATVVVTFGEYAGALLNSSIKASIGALAAGIILAMTALRIWGTRPIGRAQGPIVAVVVALLAVLAGVTHAIASFVPAFVALLGLGLVGFTARHAVRPAQPLSRAPWSQPVLGRDLGWRGHVGLLGAATVSLIFALLLNLTAMAAIGGAVSLLIFAPIVVSHLQIYRQTGARLRRLAVALLTIVILFSVGVLDILLNGLTATMTVIAIAGLAVILDVLRSRIRTSQPSGPPVLAVLKGGLNEY